MLDNILSIYCCTFSTVDGKTPPPHAEQTTLPHPNCGHPAKCHFTESQDFTGPPRGALPFKSAEAQAQVA